MTITLSPISDPGTVFTLPEESRSFSITADELLSQQGRAADGTLHIDYINQKQSWTIQYTVLSEATRAIIRNAFLAQISEASGLTFTFDDSTGTPVAHEVTLDAPTFGPIIEKATYFYVGVTLTLREL